MVLITENQLDDWVRGHARDAQGLIVELIWRLVAASSPRPKERRFPLGDSIGQPGPDGVLDTDFDFGLFVPQGRSYWEIGTGLDAGTKATSDYRELSAATPELTKTESAFVFVTPLSGRRDWQHTWKEDSQARWLEERRQRNEWREVRIIDGSVLIDWLHSFPAVEQWLAGAMGLPIRQMQTPEQRWVELRTIGEPPPLTPHIFLTNRDKACEKLQELFAGTSLQLKLDTHYPDQVVDFVSAYIANMEDESRIDAVSRCLIISGIDAWNVVTTLRERHVLVADFDLDDADSSGSRILEKARRAGHAVIFGGMPGGIPHPNRVMIPNPKSYQIKDALEKAGHKEERARILAQRCDGNLGTLLRCLQNLSLMPEWAEHSNAAELAIAELLGSWNEQAESDRLVIETLAGKSYGEWIEKIREFAICPGAPLIHRDGLWKVVSRYEGWYALGSRVFDEHLDRLKLASIKVFRELDPKFDLQPEERYAAAIHGKVLTHSRALRTGLADTLALLGSHSKALTSCSFGKAEATAVVTVREVLKDADGVLWASINDQLPLLAEAAPEEFLDNVEKSLSANPCPFDYVLAQEGNGIMGSNYMTGLLWALETLAWDSKYLTQVIMILGELASHDSGGKWANRPANSLTTILLPWYPQTCAPISKRKSAVETLIRDFPDIAWKLLLSLLPESHQTSSGTRKPAWREVIPDDWSSGSTHSEYWEQTTIYAELTLNIAKQDLDRLASLVNRLDDMPLPIHEQFLAHLGSDVIVSLPETSRLRLWTELVDLVTKHRKFSEAQWAMSSEQVDKIADVANKLAPKASRFRYLRLFSERDFDLYEEKGNWEEQQEELESRRKKAIEEIYLLGNITAVLEFAKSVESPWRAGISFGLLAVNDSDNNILPELLNIDQKPLALFAGGYVLGRHRNGGWNWVDELNCSQWQPIQIGQFLAYLPFSPETWDRVAKLLSADESYYWSKTNANPYMAERGLEYAINRLVEYGRPHAAIGCIYKMLHDKEPLDPQKIVRVLLAAIHSSEGFHSMDDYYIVEIIKALQESPSTNPDDLFKVEWAYLTLLDGHHGGTPKLIEQRLSEDPEFFCEVIGIVFRPKDKAPSNEELTDQQKNIATNAYRLLSHWKTPPGTQIDGSYKGEKLVAWLERVKAACTKSGHLEVALSKVGHVLVYAPADPSGLYLHRSVAEVLNAKDASELRDGFRNELYNSRGAHWVDPEGKPEQELVAKYSNQAEEIESAGYHRLAGALRDLASSYNREAERLRSRNLLDD